MKKKFMATDIEYAIEEEDVMDDINFDDCDDNEDYETAIENAIDSIKRDLPAKLCVEIEVDEDDDEDTISDAIVDAVSDETGWLIESLNYEELDEPEKENPEDDAAIKQFFDNVLAEITPRKEEHKPMDNQKILDTMNALINRMCDIDGIYETIAFLIDYCALTKEDLLDLHFSEDDIATVELDIGLYL